MVYTIINPKIIYRFFKKQMLFHSSLGEDLVLSD
ncbi:hypothetical protein HNP81_004583 [Peribacillus huizhouensis]|uniref:Uncharacterized protein n=1 Tax=Peribacillus huizhouensis TaxID=1501239 RepID=A0ABR6CX78_9BACI|nr:hypothetical protein [Peribacillus huizhouensis]